MIVKTQNAILANILKVQKGFKLQIRVEPSSFGQPQNDT